MEAKDLAEKFKGTEKKTNETYSEVIQWCQANLDHQDLNDPDEFYLYEMATRYLMKIKIGKWEEADARVVVNYMAKIYAINNGIGDDVSISILDDEAYRAKFKDNSNATCQSKSDGTTDVFYSGRVIDNLTSSDTIRFLRGLQTIFHEIVHSKQYSEIYKKDDRVSRFSGNSYKIALETIVRKVAPDFYKENYSSLLMEYQAERHGLSQAMKMMETYYKPGLFKDANLDEFLDEMLKIDEKESYESKGSVKFRDEDINASAMISFTADNAIKAKPELINQIPVLRYGYREDGSRKSITELLQDRAEIMAGDEEIDTQRLDDLYRAIANYRIIEKGEPLELYTYITKNAVDDDFVYDLLQYRLEKSSWSQEKVNQFMMETRMDVRKLIRDRNTNQQDQEAPEGGEVSGR